MLLDNGVGIWGKAKSRLDQEEPGRSYCDFLMFVHQRTREDSGHQYGKIFYRDSQISGVAMHL